MATYRTRGRQRLLSFLYDHPDKQFTAAELYRELSGDDGICPVGKSSLYRQLAGLCDDGTVRKYRSDKEDSFVYQFVGQGDCSHHFHLKCLVCGRLIHLECSLSNDLLAHIREDHGFRVDSGRSILYGCCEACAARSSESEADPEAKGKDKVHVE